jgi:pyrroline-5-carboxylate reductase
MSDLKKKISILGGGNIGSAIALGLVNSKLYQPSDIIITRRNQDLLKSFLEKGFQTSQSNARAVEESEIIIVAVTPQQLNELLSGIKNSLDPVKHTLISIVSGATISQIRKEIVNNVAIIRAMPNTAIAIQESMTCISANPEDHGKLEIAKNIFDALGKSLVIEESLMVPATALCACGIAFFLRAVRAASQGGIEIGFHAEDALIMAAQTAKGAATLLLSMGNHPENEVDKVTTPRGCTISGLNQMEHSGFSSAMIKGITTSAEKAAQLYSPAEK